MSIFDRRNEPTPSLEPVATQRYNAPRALTASAARIDLKNKKEVEAINKRRQTDKWQEESWEYFDLIGEIKASANLISNVMSRINLYGGFVEDTASVPTNVKAVASLEEEFVKAVEDTLYLLESGNGGTSGLLRTAGLNMFVAGECYLVREPARFSTGEPDKWQIRSVKEIVSVTGRNSQAVIRPRRDSKPADFIPLPNNGYLCRLWRNHAAFSDEADSSVRGILDLCDQLLLVDRLASATAKSRLNAGLLFVPDGLSNITQNDGAVEGEEAPLAADESDSFEEELIDSMVTPIADASSASSVVPLVVRGPAELGEKIVHIKFERAFDAQLAQRAERLLDRILAGLDIPLDVAKGLSGVKYSNAILIEEQLYKAHIEPLILLIVDQLTVGFLRPALRAQGYPEEMVSRAVVWYDPSAITAKPNKAEAAQALYEAGAISQSALRRASGFTDADAPSQLEVTQKMAIERAILDEAWSAMALSTIAPKELQEQARQTNLAQSDPASANALTEALGGTPAPEGAPAPETLIEGAPAPEDGETPLEETTAEAPPTLMEP